MDVIKDQLAGFDLFFISIFFLFPGEILLNKRRDGRTQKRFEDFKKGTGWICFPNDELKSFRKKKKKKYVYILRDSRFLPREFNLIFEPPAGQPSCVCCTYNVQLYLLIFDVFRQLPDVRRNMNLRRPRGIITFFSLSLFNIKNEE
jgi:hypothetical protein